MNVSTLHCHPHLCCWNVPHIVDVHFICSKFLLLPMRVRRQRCVLLCSSTAQRLRTTDGETSSQPATVQPAGWLNLVFYPSSKSQKLQFVTNETALVTLASSSCQCCLHVLNEIPTGQSSPVQSIHTPRPLPLNRLALMTSLLT